MRDVQAVFDAIIEYIGILEEQLQQVDPNLDWKEINKTYRPSMRLYELQNFINGERERRQQE
jgi:hypothetical protein